MTDDPAHEPVTTENLLRHLDEGWAALQAYLGPLAEAQIAGPTDAEGWTVKDHLMHIVRCEKGMLAMLDKKPYGEGLGVDPALWEADIDEQNAVMKEEDEGKSVGEVRQALRDSHERMRAKLASLTDADLVLPRRHFGSSSAGEDPIIWTIVGNTYGHYEEHLPWMKAITASD